MTSSKKLRVIIMIILVVILTLNLFVFLNFKIFNKKMSHLKEAKIACEGLDLESECGYVFMGNITDGVCKKVKKDILVCKALKAEKGS